MSLSTISATGIQDPTGQVFANGTWSLFFTPTYGRSGPFTDGGVVFTRIYGGSLDATGSFSQPNVNRSDTISPGGSTWMLQVTPAISGQTFQVLLNVNSPAFDCTTAINAVITAQAPAGLVVSATAIARAYKDSELINPDGAGALYYDETLKVLKIWDAPTSTFLPLTPNNGSPTFLNLTVLGQALIKNFENTQYADNFAGADMSAKIVAAYNALPATGGIVDATAFQGAQNWSVDPFAGINFGSTKGLWLKLGNVAISCSVPINVKCSNVIITGVAWQQTSITYTGGATASFWKYGTATPTVTQLIASGLRDIQISGNANVTDVLFLSGVIHSFFERIDLRNCTTAGLHTQFCVGNDYKDISCTLNHGAFTTQPATGLWFDQIDANHQTTGSPVICPIIEGLSGSGIKMTGCEGMYVVGGSSEQNNRGAEITNACFRNTFDTVEFEGNTVEDVLDGGVATEFRNCVSLGKYHFTGARPRVVGGSNNSYQIDTGVNNSHIDSTWNWSGTGTVLDNGTNTKWDNLTNPTTGNLQTLIAGSGSFGGGAGTEPTSGWSFRNTTPRKGDPSIGQPDAMSMLRGSFSFVTTGLILDNTPITSATWRLLFVGSWANNFEGGGLTQPAIIQEVTSAASTLTIGTQVVTFSKNGSNQLVGTSTANVIEFVGTIFVCSNIQGLTGTASALYKGSVIAPGLPQVIATGTSTLTANAALGAVTSQAAITTAATGVLTTDVVKWSYASAPGAGDSLCHVSAYPTAANVNFVRTNPTAAAQNVSAIVINWRVIR